MKHSNQVYNDINKANVKQWFFFWKIFLTPNSITCTWYISWFSKGIGVHLQNFLHTCKPCPSNTAKASLYFQPNSFRNDMCTYMYMYAVAVNEKFLLCFCWECRRLYCCVCIALLLGLCQVCIAFTLGVHCIYIGFALHLCCNSVGIASIGVVCQLFLCVG